MTNQLLLFSAHDILKIVSKPCTLYVLDKYIKPSILPPNTPLYSVDNKKTPVYSHNTIEELKYYKYKDIISTFYICRLIEDNYITFFDSENLAEVTSNSHNRLCIFYNTVCFISFEHQDRLEMCASNIKHIIGDKGVLSFSLNEKTHHLEIVYDKNYSEEYINQEKTVIYKPLRTNNTGIVYSDNLDVIMIPKSYQSILIEDKVKVDTYIENNQFYTNKGKNDGYWGFY